MSNYILNCFNNGLKSWGNEYTINIFIITKYMDRWPENYLEIVPPLVYFFLILLKRKILLIFTLIRDKSKWKQRFLFKYIWLYWVLVVSCGIFVASCIMLHCGNPALELLCRLSYSKACGILVPPPEMNPHLLHCEESS